MNTNHQCACTHIRCILSICIGNTSQQSESGHNSSILICDRPPKQARSGSNDDHEKCVDRLGAPRTAMIEWLNIRQARCGGFITYEAALFKACLDHPDFERMSRAQRRKFARVMLRLVPNGTQYALPFSAPDDPNEYIGGVTFYTSVRHYRTGQRIYPKTAKAFPIPLNSRNEKMSYRAFNARLDVIFEAVMRLRRAA
jgi:hypothetical protein